MVKERDLGLRRRFVWCSGRGREHGLLRHLGPEETVGVPTRPSHPLVLSPSKDIQTHVRSVVHGEEGEMW